MAKKQIRTDIICNLEDCMKHDSRTGICTHNRPDLWLWKDTDTVDWKCNTYTFNELFKLSKEELDKYNETRKREVILKQISRIKELSENPSMGKSAIIMYSNKLKELRKKIGGKTDEKNN